MNINFAYNSYKVFSINSYIKKEYNKYIVKYQFDIGHRHVDSDEYSLINIFPKSKENNNLLKMLRN